MTSTRAGSARVGPWHVAILVPIWGAAAWLHVWYGNRHHFFDLGIYYRAVRWWAHGHDVYSYSQPDSIQGSLGFTYPPFAALLLRPLASMPLGAAQAVFGTVSVAALLVTLWLLIRPVAARLGYPTWFALALALPLVSWLEPVRETFSFGQVNFIVTGLIVVDLLVAVARGSRLAGVGIGLAAAIKLTPAIFVIYLLLTRRWRAAATAVAAAITATLLGAVPDWHSWWRFWTELVWQTGRIGRLDRVQNQSLTGALARLTGHQEPNQLGWLLLAALVGAYGLWRARSAALAGDEVTGLTLTALVGCVVSPVTWSHHLVWFAAALVVLVDVALDSRRPPGRRWPPAALAVVLYATVAYSVVLWVPDWHIVGRWATKGVPGFLIGNWYLLLMFVLLAVLPIRRPADTDNSGTGHTGTGHHADVSEIQPISSA
jgi:alpha-1,2-mannosyltransferase